MFGEQNIVNIAFEKQRKHNKTPNNAQKVEDSESAISPHLLERCQSDAQVRHFEPRFDTKGRPSIKDDSV